MEEVLIKKLAREVVEEGRLFLSLMSLHESGTLPIDQFFELTETIARFMDACERVAKISSELGGPPGSQAVKPKNPQRRYRGQK